MTDSGSHGAVDLSDWHALAKQMIDTLCDSDRQRMPRIIGVRASGKQLWVFGEMNACFFLARACF